MKPCGKRCPFLDDDGLVFGTILRYTMNSENTMKEDIKIVSMTGKPRRTLETAVTLRILSLSAITYNENETI